MKMSWETVYWVSQLLLVVFAGVALVSGAVVNKRQSKQLLTLETSLEEQREKTAKAEADTLELRKTILGPRHFTPEAWEKAKGILRNAPKGAVAISYMDDNMDSMTVAAMVSTLATESGWKVVSSEAISRPNFAVNSGTLIVFSTEGWTPTNENPEKLPEPADALYRALLAGSPETGKIVWIGEASRKPGDPILVVIGPKI